MIDLAKDELDGSSTNSGGDAGIFAELLKRRHVSTMAFRPQPQAPGGTDTTCTPATSSRPTHPVVAKRISPYRASYLPEDRRRIEKRPVQTAGCSAFSTTNAMELGVDVGNLDATITHRIPRHHRQRVAAGGAQRSGRVNAP